MSARTIGEIVAALDALQAAVLDDNREAYRAGLTRARLLGCTPEQIEDAYRYGAIRRTSSFFRPPVDFGVDG